MLTTISHHAMATEFSVLLARSDAHLVEAAFEALEMLDRIEAKLTIYRENSEISRLNAGAAQAPVAVSPTTFELLRRSLEWSDRTGGAFDVTSGPLVRIWGFTQRRGKKPDAAEIGEALEKVGYQNVRLEPRDRTAAFEKPGMEINLGAIGKGHALDQLVDGMRKRGLENFLIHGGGSSIIARGNQIPDSDEGWAVGISHPTKPKQRVAGIRLRDQALSTSGSGKQFFHFRGRRYGHVIDPRSGYPAGELLALTAVADNATDAEACSTGYFVQGVDAIRAAAEADASLPKLLGIRAGRRQDAVDVLAFGEFDWIDPPQNLAENRSE